MNNNALALIVGGLVVAVAALLFFGTDIFRTHKSAGDGDINVTIEAPAPAPAN